ncbi:MAG: hypothetical protein GY896_22890 [Gammaproteobacteria bacterium]|nr:hypothetical protein [Gammaproteobacteria bacterium]
MKKEDIDEGKKLAQASLKWWRTTLPSFEHESHSDEPIPKLVKWLNRFAFPALAAGVDAQKTRLSRRKTHVKK